MQANNSGGHDHSARDSSGAQNVLLAIPMATGVGATHADTHSRTKPPLAHVSSSYSDDAFVCESPDAVMASQRTNPSAAYGFNEDGTIFSDHGTTTGPSRGSSSQQSSSTSGGRRFGANQQLYEQDSTRQLQQQQQMHQPLVSQSLNSEDLEDPAVPYGELAQPRPEIVLRWKRFALLVLLAAVSISAMTYALVIGIPMPDVPEKEAEDRVQFINSFSGVVMGFLETILGLLLGNLLPVFVVYLHNLKWYPSDDPAQKASRFKKVALLLFIPLIMVALGNSLSAVQANQKTMGNSDNDRMRARHLQQQHGHSTTEAATRRLLVEHSGDDAVRVGQLEDTVLRAVLMRRVVPAPALSASKCANKNELSGLLHALPTASFGFPLRDWNRRVYPDPSTWHATRVTTLRRQDTFESADVSQSLTSRVAAELLVQGLQQLQTLGLGSGVSVVDSASLQELLARDASDAINSSRLLREIERSLTATRVGSLDAGTLAVNLARSTLSPLIAVDSMTIDVEVVDAPPLSTDTHQVACGAQSCVLLTTDASPHFLPRQQIAMTRYCNDTGATDACESDKHAAFVFGFTSTVVARASTNSADSMTLQTSTRRHLTLSFSKLSWTLDTFATTCAPTASSGSECRVLHHPLVSGNEHLVVSANQLQQRLDAISSTRPLRLVQIVDRSASVGQKRVRVERLANSAELLLLPSSGDVTDSCFAAVDAYEQYVQANRLALDRDLIQPAFTAALLYLLQDAVVVTRDSFSDESVELAVARRLLSTSPEDMTITIYATNTTVGRVSTWIGCVVMFVLSTLVFVLPNERARLEPPKGGNARAERFIAVQTEEAYPNLVYKKRFLIGKTGEEIKFGEFAVESVGLHHRMEEDEQIYL